MRVRLAGGAVPETCRGKRTILPPVRLRDSPPQPEKKRRPPQPQQEQPRQQKAAPAAGKRSRVAPEEEEGNERADEKNEVVMRKLKRQLKVQQEEMVKLQAALLENQKMMMHMAGCHATTAVPKLPAKAKASTKAAAAPVPPEARGAMSLEVLAALSTRMSTLSEGEMLRALQVVGMPPDATEMDLEALDAVQQWKLHDFEEALHRPVASPRKPVGRPRKPRKQRAGPEHASKLEAATAANARQLEQVRAMRTALAQEAETSEVASSVDGGEDRWQTGGTWDEEPTAAGGGGEEEAGDEDDGAEALLEQLEGAEGCWPDEDGWAELEPTAGS